MEIHTPKLIPGASEGGANVFKLKYFGKEACLAQSPQLYKQMCIMSDLKRVFEIGPVFRAENSFTHRHMCEFTGLDIEMVINEHYFELMDFMGELFIYIFEGIEKRYAAELKAIDHQYPFEPFVCKKPVLKLTFEEACKLLKENGVEQSVHEDFNTEIEKKLGVFVKAKYGTDFYMVHRYPVAARPFYTMVCKDDNKFTNSYDFFMRGEEITSGSQRVHDAKMLEIRAKEFGIEVETIRGYIDAFKYGAYPHGGCGIGLERVVMLYCALGNIRNASLFPRDPKRILP
jgi:aspartyl-tRNA synthetase